MTFEVCRPRMACHSGALIPLNLKNIRLWNIQR
nr:MAG TPA_asm: hypothetical protein [Caudoviricetes sp.]